MTITGLWVLPLPSSPCMQIGMLTSGLRPFICTPGIDSLKLCQKPRNIELQSATDSISCPPRSTSGHSASMYRNQDEGSSTGKSTFVTLGLPVSGEPGHRYGSHRQVNFVPDEQSTYVSCGQHSFDFCPQFHMQQSDSAPDQKYLSCGTALS